MYSTQSRTAIARAWLYFRLALLHQGCLWAVGSPADVLTPAHLAAVFGLDVLILETPIGLQICPISPIT
ncbi:MAG: hypothetical protein F6K28_23840 [Microcoleus sp. SIO2G3]|nr:hypothetical protein [Microcoleus sp. SIO2G3]